MEENHICKKCGGIAGWDSYFQSWVCTRCGDEEPKPITNGDRIRAMSDEELADYLRYYSDSYARYDMDWLDWLKQKGE